MWIIRKDGKAINLANAEMLRYNNDLTEVMIGKTWWIVSCKNVMADILEAMRKNQDYLEVE
jgi:hypothetical protein